MRLVQLEVQDNLEKVAQGDPVVLLVPLVKEVQLVHLAALAQEVHLDLLDQLVHQAHKVPEEN